MEPHIRAWDQWMRALGDFYSYKDTDGAGRVYEVHRRSIHPVMRVCREWGSLLLNDKTQVTCDDQGCTDWLAAWMAHTGFLASAQERVVRAFDLGTGAWTLWPDAGAGEVRVRRYDARMVVPLTWDEEGVTESRSRRGRSGAEGRSTRCSRISSARAARSSRQAKNWNARLRRLVLLAQVLLPLKTVELRARIESSRHASTETGTASSRRACARCTTRDLRGRPSRS